jgi:Fe-Mn family superoxide dismutase
MNSLLEPRGEQPGSLEDVVRAAAAGGERKLYNNAAQTWNHAFFWDCMAPGGAGPGDGVREAAERAFGGWDQLRTRFVGEGVDHFASGWAWLVARNGGLEVLSTHDAGIVRPVRGRDPAVVCDVGSTRTTSTTAGPEGFLEKWFDGVANGAAERQWRPPGGAAASALPPDGGTPGAHVHACARSPIAIHPERHHAPESTLDVSAPNSPSSPGPHRRAPARGGRDARASCWPTAIS